MQNRRDFLKMGIVGSAFLPTFANLIAKADQKAPVGQGKAREINIGIVGFDTINPILSNNRDIQYIDKLVFEPLVDITKDFKVETKLAKEEETL